MWNFKILKKGNERKKYDEGVKERREISCFKDADRRTENY